jgi:hypothetical protein
MESIVTSTILNLLTNSWRRLTNSRRLLFKHTFSFPRIPKAEKTLLSPITTHNITLHYITLHITIHITTHNSQHHITSQSTMMPLILLSMLSLLQGTSGFGVSFCQTSSRSGGTSKVRSKSYRIIVCVDTVLYYMTNSIFLLSFQILF